MVERAGQFSELIAQSGPALPGPSSSQLGMAIGTQRAGVLGGAAAWLGFTLPSAVVMRTCPARRRRDVGLAGAPRARARRRPGGGAGGARDVTDACAVRSSARDGGRRRVVALAWAVGGQAAAILFGGAVGVVALGSAARPPALTGAFRSRRIVAVASLAAFAVSCSARPAPRATDGGVVPLVHWMYRSARSSSAGATSFFRCSTTRSSRRVGSASGTSSPGMGWRPCPGSSFSFSSYLGAIRDPGPNGVVGAGIAVCAIYLVLSAPRRRAVFWA